VPGTAFGSALEAADSRIFPLPWHAILAHARGLPMGQWPGMVKWLMLRWKSAEILNGLV
jgi:hypothetical protein